MIRVNATGCSLVDNLYGAVDFRLNDYKNLLSHRVGDGGLITGGLVFAEALSSFASRPYEELLVTLTENNPPDSSNIGGPGIVPIIHAAQVNDNQEISYRFAGVVGCDENGQRIRDMMARAGFPMTDYSESSLPTPSTDVLSDPDWDNHRGERTFINRIGAAGQYSPEALPSDFFDAELLLFGGTGLVPPLHDSLDRLCSRGREAGAFVMVTTVFDFRNEALMKGKPWPLVEDYGNIDLLGVDREEALKISGTTKAEDAIEWFLKKGCGAVIVTQGAREVLLGIGTESRFAAPGRRSMPTCRYADTMVENLTHPRDTTGCGDNFTGGVIDSIARQLAEAGKEPEYIQLNLEAAVAGGIVAGSFALTCLGGVFYETEPGQKRAAMRTVEAAYRRELEGINE